MAHGTAVPSSQEICLNLVVAGMHHSSLLGVQGARKHRRRFEPPPAMSSRRKYLNRSFFIEGRDEHHAVPRAGHRRAARA